MAAYCRDDLKHLWVDYLQTGISSSLDTHIEYGNVFYTISNSLDQHILTYMYTMCQLEKCANFGKP